MKRLNHLQEKIQAIPDGPTKDALCEMCLILEWFYEMIEENAKE